MTSTKTLFTAETRAMMIDGLTIAVKADKLTAKAKETTKGAYSTLMQAAVACGSGEAVKALWTGLQVEIKGNVGGLAAKMGAAKSKKGDYLVPKSASNAMSRILAAYELGISLLETDEKGEVTDTPKSFSALRAEVTQANQEADAAAIAQSNPALAEAMALAAELRELATVLQSNAGYLADNPDATIGEAIATLGHAVHMLAERSLAAQAEAEKAEAEAKAGDKLAEAEAEAATPKPSKKAANK